MLLLKIGGGADINIPAIADDLKTLSQPTIIVHGANALRNQIARRMDIPIQEVTSLSGYSSVFSDQELVDLMMMTYAGLANKSIVQALQQRGIPAIGLSGLDAGLIRGKRNPGIRTMEAGKKVLKRDLSGKPTSVNTKFLLKLIQDGYLPVLTVPILDEQGVAVNAENDEIVALLHQELGVEHVVQLIEAPGLLAEKENADSLISNLSVSELRDWEGRCEGRMRRKLLALGKLMRHHAAKVYIADGRRSKPITLALQGAGTVIQ